MSDANTNLRVTELDFDNIKNNLKDFLRSQDKFKDYDFDGSAMSFLIDLLAYNTHYNAMYLNMAANEAHLDTAKLRSSVVSHAAKLGYVPKSRVSPKAVVDIMVTPGEGEDNTVNSITLSKYTRFFSNPIDSIAYNFVNLDSNVAVKSNGTFLFANVALYEGEHVSANYTVSETNTKRRFVLPSSNIYTDSISVSVQESVSNSDTKTYTQFDDLTELKSNSYVYFLEETSDANASYVIYFGDDILGKKPSNGNIVIVNYLETNGPDANKANVFVGIDSIDGYSSNVIVLPKSAATGGAYKESLDSVRFTAPRFYTTQNRIVTNQDFETILLKDYPNIQTVSVWGGEEENPPIYGRVYLSIKPVNNYYLSEADKDTIINDIIHNKSVMTIDPVIIDPDYNFIKTNITVEYNKDKTTKTRTELTELIREVVYSYSDNYLNSFSGAFRSSQITKDIDTIDPAINGSFIKTYLQKRQELTIGETKNYTIKFNQALAKEGLAKLSSFPTITVRDLTGVDRNVYFEEIRGSYNGIQKIEVINPGSGFTSTPTVTVTGDGTGATATATIVNGGVSSITVVTPGSDYYRANITISGTGSGATAQAILFNRLGTLQTYYYRDNGEKIIVDDNAGTIDYETGIISLTNLTPYGVAENSMYSANVITFSVSPQNDIIYSNKNQINLIDRNDSSAVTVSFIDEK